MLNGAFSGLLVSVPVATSDSQKLSLTADRQGVTVLYATDAANNMKAELQVAVGNFRETAGHACRSNRSDLQRIRLT